MSHDLDVDGLARLLMRRLCAIADIDTFYDHRTPDGLSSEYADEIADFLVTECLMNYPPPASPEGGPTPDQTASLDHDAADTGGA